MKNKIAKITSIILTVILITTMFTGCSNSSVNPSNETNNVTYSDYTFWEQANKVRITLPIELTAPRDDDPFKELGNLELSSKYLEKVEKLKLAMVSYFQEVYNIDISERLVNQKLRAFTAEDVNGNTTMGYVCPDSPDYLNLNNQLFSEYKDYFNNTYVHETLHQLGFISDDSTMITEGIVDALTDLILRKANIKSVTSDTYYDIRVLGYQILASDDEIAEFYLDSSNPKMSERITNRLKDVEKPFEKVNVGKRLESLLNGLTYGVVSDTIDIYYVAFEAQEIVRSYCQTFNPDTDTIDYIRSHYLVLDYESITITADGKGYQFSLDE